MDEEDMRKRAMKIVDMWFQEHSQREWYTRIGNNIYMFLQMNTNPYMTRC